MLQADVFASLMAGTKIDRKRFSSSIGRFNSGSTTQPRAASAPAARRDQENESAQPSGKAAKRRKKNKQKQSEAAAVELLDDGVSLFRAKAQTGALDIEPAAEAPAASKTHDPFEEANSLRKEHRIRVTGSSIPDPLKDFAELRAVHKAPKRLMANLSEMLFQTPTAIQRQATTALMEGRELFAVAPTGSGKTLAFLLPLVLSICRRRKEARDRGDEDALSSGVSAVVVSPTRELAAQTARALATLTSGMKIKGVLLSKATAAGADFSKVDVVMATPLLLKQLTEEERLDLSGVRHLVLDEADRLFDLGFLEQVDEIITACSHEDVVRALFSATLPEKVEELARTVLRDPIRITVGERNAATDSVQQKLEFVGTEEGRALALQQLLRGGVRPPVLVFVGTKERAQALYKKLLYDGFHIDCIHSDQSQAARTAAVNGFRVGKTWVLIATDLVARGMDFVGVNTVVNYDFPNSTTDYIHRIGRTGRGGLTGNAVTFFTEDDAWQLRSIANVMSTAGCAVPPWMMSLKKTPKRQERRHQRERQQKVAKATETLHDSVLPKYDRQKKDRKTAIVAASKRKRQ